MRRRVLYGVCFLAGFATGVVILLLAGFGSPRSSPMVAPSPPPAPPWNESLGSSPRFVDVTRQAGISFQHENGETGKYHYPEIMGAGIGLFDYNGDGFLDIYFVNGNNLVGPPKPGATNRLYRNDGNWTFTDVTAEAKVGHDGFGQGCCAADYDNDGDQDLYVSNFGPNVLYRNEGNGTFTDVTTAAGVTDPNWGQTCSFLDCDGDGLLDLYVQNYLTYSLEMNVETFIALGSKKMLDYASPGNFQGSADHLYRNQGDGTFVDITKDSGMYRPDGKGMGCACVDFDDDGFVDIFVANDGMDNFYFKSKGNCKFDELGLSLGVAFDGSGIPEASMGVDVGDYDRDGRFDMIVPCVRKQSYTLYRNKGDHFEDVSSACGLTQLTSEVTGFSPNFLDFDNDGDLDLFFTTGAVRAHELASPDASYTERYGIPDILLANDGKGRYVDVSHRAGECFQRVLIGRGSAVGDLDNDGDMDLVISNLAGPAQVLRNETLGGHWITLQLVPRGGNRDAIGATVWIEAAGVRQRGLVHGGVAYLSQQDRRVHFGLGKAAQVDRVTVTWPDREQQVLEGLEVDRIHKIVQGTAAPR